MAAILIPLAWVISGDLAGALRYNAIFLAVLFAVDLLLLWKNRE